MCEFASLPSGSLEHRKGCEPVASGIPPGKFVKVFKLMITSGHRPFFSSNFFSKKFLAKFCIRLLNSFIDKPHFDVFAE